MNEDKSQNPKQVKIKELEEEIKRLQDELAQIKKINSELLEDVNPSSVGKA